jgi:phosphatidylglycerophosphatase C
LIGSPALDNQHDDGRTRGLAVFDFDGTLIQGDSLYPFCRMIAGERAARWHVAGAVRDTILNRLRGAGQGTRSGIKSRFLARALAGVTVERARIAADALADWVRWHQPMRDALQRHADRGDRVIVATGALALYMPRLLSDLPVSGLLATEMEVVDGVLTGRMQGGNCVRAEKARRVAALIAEQGPFAGTWGYGNHPSDRPFLALMQHGTVVRTVHRRNRQG